MKCKPGENNPHQRAAGVSRAGPTAALNSAPRPSPTFTGEEAIVLRAFATGKCARQVRTELRISPRSLDRLLRDLREKTGTADHLAMLAWARRQMKSSGEAARIVDL
jgi:DNA-binding CsgD family transcriptional regulator